MEKRFYPTKIIYFESFENFSIQLLKNVQIIKRLTDKIQNYVKNATIDNIEKLEVGKHCLVLILTINGKLWHRCVIESIDDGITVYLRDKGYSVKIIAEENIMSIPSEFDLIEDGAIKCSMFDVDVEDNHDSEIQQKLMRKVGKHVEQISMKIHDTCYDQRLSVTLWGKHKHLFAIGYTNINKIIKENGCEASFDIITNPNKFASTEDICERIKLQNDFIAIDFADKIDFKKIRVKIDSSKCENDRIYHYEMKEKDVIDWLPSEPIQMENFQAIATYVDRKCRIFVQEEKEIIEAEILSKKITDYIKEVYGKKKVKSYALEKGKPCFSMYADGQFYRGKIKRIIQADNCCVVGLFYVIFSNSPSSNNFCFSQFF